MYEEFFNTNHKSDINDETHFLTEMSNVTAHNSCLFIIWVLCEVYHAAYSHIYMLIV